MTCPTHVVPRRAGGLLIRLGLLAALLLATRAPAQSAADAVDAEFGYRELTVRVLDADGNPVPDARLYAWCRQRNLLWPRPPADDYLQYYLVWREAHLGKTDEDGSTVAELPPGSWLFVAVGRAGDKVVCAWTQADMGRTEQVVLQPTSEATVQFSLTARDPLRPSRLLLRPQGTDIWLPVALPAAAEQVALQLSAGAVDLWAQGEGDDRQPSFVLDFGRVSPSPRPVRLLARGQPARVELAEPEGMRFRWFRHGEYGLCGTVGAGVGELLLSPAEYTLGYEGPLGPNALAHQAARYLDLRRTPRLRLGPRLPLRVGVETQSAIREGEQEPKDYEHFQSQARYVRFYLVDANSFLVSYLANSQRQPLEMQAWLVSGGRAFPLTQVGRGQMLFQRPEGREVPLNRVVRWGLRIPGADGLVRGEVCTQTRPVRSRHFSCYANELVVPHVQALLTAFDQTRQAFGQVCGRTRSKGLTRLHLWAEYPGAAATTDGSFLNFGADFLDWDQAYRSYVWWHELAHGYDYHHGGFMEMMLEASRCSQGPMLSGQTALWDFHDAMNGRPARHPERYRLRNIYLWAYAEGGRKFLQAAEALESRVRPRLMQRGATEDEVDAVLLETCLRRDLGEIFARYGLDAPAARRRAMHAVLRR